MQVMKRAGTLAEKIVPAKQRQIWNYSQLSKWLVLNIQARAGSHKPRTIFSNLCFSEARGMNFVVDRCRLRQLWLLSHSPWVGWYLVKTRQWYQWHNLTGQRIVRYQRVTSIPRYRKSHFRKRSFVAVKATVTSRSSPGTLFDLACTSYLVTATPALENCKTRQQILL